MGSELFVDKANIYKNYPSIINRTIDFGGRHMANTLIETKDGTKIRIEGTAEEIAKIMKLYGGSTASNERLSRPRRAMKVKTSPTTADRIRELIAEGFFDKPKGLAELKAGLEQQGYFYPITTLAARILGLVKRRELRRIKEGKRWRYTCG